MKTLCFTLFLFLPTLLAAQACDYNKLFQEGKTFAKQRQYKKALYKFNSARRCDPAQGETVDAAIEALLDQVEGEKKAANEGQEKANQQKKIAEAEKKRAEDAFIKADNALAEATKQKQIAESQQKLVQSALIRTDSALAEVKKQQKKNEKIINAFYFYAGSFALASKEGKFGFIDKEGNPMIEYQYDEALSFDETGYANVKEVFKDSNDIITGKIAYLLDTFGNNFRLVTRIPRYDSSIVALDLSYKKLKKNSFWGI